MSGYIGEFMEIKKDVYGKENEETRKRLLDLVKNYLNLSILH